jgi:O-antigen ligase
METAAEIAGTVGVLCLLTAYFLLQKQKLSPTGGAYLGLNLAGAFLIMLSLLVHWNLPAFLLEAAWVWITLASMFKHLYLPWRRARRKP